MEQQLNKRVQPGDVWQIGKHRLLCADASDSDALARLFNGRQWDVMVTSPLYAQQRSYGLPTFDWQAMMDGVTRAALMQAAPSFHALVNLGLVHKNKRVVEYWRPWLDSCASQGIPLYGWYVWDKLHAMPGFHHGRLAPAHEFIFHFAHNPWPANKWIAKKCFSASKRSAGCNRGRNGKRKRWYTPLASLQPRKVADSLLRLSPERQKGIHTRYHPAVYPVALPEHLLRSFGRDGCTPFDPFAGSGTTALAAERCGYGAYMVELNPQYCDLILTRLESFLDMSPIKVSK